MTGAARRWMMPVICAALAAVGMIAYEASGLREAAAAPTRVAVVRMRALRELLAQEAENREQLKAMQERFQQQVATKQKEIEDLKKELLDMPDADQPEKKKDDLNLMMINLNIWGKLSEKEQMSEIALRLEDLYTKVGKAIAELAALQSYDLVIVDDAGDELPLNNDPDLPPAVQRAQRLLQKRVLYRIDSIDITDELAVRMNNAFKAGPAQ